MSPLLNGVRNLTKNGTEKAKKNLNAFFVSFVTSKTGLQETHTSEIKEKFWSKKDLLLVEKDQPRQQLNKLDIHKSVELNGLYPDGAG